ncbi:uncharacterized protein LOC106468191 [Limulus polyphemus]|uniref:Uncharacterized protein LOC106468191 n=1 Tax=Limulus polyphemus TaxID=6850 RepID=A0ABM1T8L2_LIMPO|nr:uncharacterized protein LOC106468191 [Limulus polyphemus]
MAASRSRQSLKLQCNIEEIDWQKPSPLLEDESKSGFSDQNETLSRPSLQGSVKSHTSPKPLPEYQYTKEELMDISKLPVARKRPSCLDLEFNNSCGLWDPLNWFSAVRQDEQELVEETKTKRERSYEMEKEAGVVHKRRTSDPKERIKEERDTIVLSPQRRSFGTGCHIPQQVSKQPGSSYESKESESAVHREPVRRIGSGRILARDRDQWDKDKDQQERDYGYNRCNGNRRDRLDRDDREKEGRIPGRFSDHGERRFGRGRTDVHITEEEPEWFSEGPTSQSETIELVGLDDFHQEDKREGRRSKGKKSRESFRKLALTQQDNEEANDSRTTSFKRDSPTTVECKQVQKSYETVGQLKIEEEPESKQKPHNFYIGDLFKSTAAVEYEEAQESHETFGELKTEEKPESKQTPHDFDINDLFKNDLIPELLPNGILDEPLDSQGVASSRFSQWFQRDSPAHVRLDSDPNSRRSSFQDELVAHVLSGIGDSTSQPPGVDNYFAPISPAVTQSYSEGGFSPQQLTSQQSEQDEDKNILELLHIANISLEPLLNGEADKMEDCELDHKTRNIEALEADLKNLVLGNKNKEEEELDNNAFNELLNQIGQDRGSPICVTVPPVDRSKLMHESDLLTNLMRGNTPTPPLLPSIIPTISHSHVSASSSPQLPEGGCGDLMSLLKGRTSHSDVHNAQDVLGFPAGDELAQLLNQKQGISVDMLAKLLNVQEPTSVSNQTFCEPVSVQTSPQGFTDIHVNSAFESGNRTDPHSMRGLVDLTNLYLNIGVICSFGLHCWNLSSNTTIVEYECEHMEADASVFFIYSQMCKAGIQIPVIIDAVDPDVVVLAAYVAHRTQGILAIKYKKSFIDCKALYSKEVADIVILLHIHSGSETTTALLGHGKKTVFMRASTSAEARTFLRQVGANIPGTQQVLDDVAMYMKTSWDKHSRSPPSPLNHRWIIENPCIALRYLQPALPSNFQALHIQEVVTVGPVKFEYNDFDDEEDYIDNTSKINPQTLISEFWSQTLGPLLLNEQLLVHSAAVLPRVPSPQELAVHTQSILQNALIKRKLEEQKENFRRRQEAQRTQSPSIPSMMNKPGIVNGSSPKGLSPTMAAFTPTSVMRKMQSEKERESPVEKANQPAVFPIKKSLNISTVPIVTVSSQLSPTRVQRNDATNGDQRQKQQQALATSSQALCGPGRPILKGSSSQSTAADHFGRGGSKIGAGPRKPFLGPTQSIAKESFVKLMEQQRLLQHQQAQALLAAQRQLNASPMPPTSFCMGPRAPASLNNNLVRPGSVGLSPNLNIMLLRNFFQNNMNIHNVRESFGNLPGLGRQHLMPVQGAANRQSPVNLTKWFGSDVLKQQMPDMPPVPHQRAYLVEELERQQQAASVHH